MSKINVPLLRKVQKKILAEPAAFMMDLYVERAEPGTEWVSRTTELRRIVPPCGTIACIAGWVNIFGGRKSDLSQSYNAQQLLRLTDIQRDELFYLGEWPQKFTKRWDKAKTLKGRARIAADRIDDFIARYAPKKR